MHMHRYGASFPILRAGHQEECTPYQTQATSKSVLQEGQGVYASAEAASNQEVFGRDRDFLATFPKGSPQAWYSEFV